MTEKELNDLCDDIFKMVMEMDERMQAIVKRHEQAFILAFRKARDKIILELKQVQERVKDFMARANNEESFQHIQRELRFFRDQSIALDELRKDLQAKHEQLIKEKFTLQQEKSEQTKLLHKLTDENIILKSTITKLRDQAGLQHSMSPSPDRAVLATSKHFMAPIMTNSNRFAPTATSRARLPSEDTIEVEQPIRVIKRAANSRADLIQTTDDNELHKLFKDCVQNLMREIHLRKLQQRVKKKNDELQRNSQHENKLIENDNSFVKVTKLDQKDLIEKFMTSRKFMEILEAKIFNLQCCQHSDCLYNYKQQPRDTPSRSNGPSTARRESSNIRINKIKRQQIEAYKPDWMTNSSHIQDEKFEYQTRLAELKKLEREMITASKRDKEGFRTLKNRFEDASSQLYELSHLIKHKM